ncbi:hypothetical protein ACFFGH_20375 [Lysobacter korlensis]|uniref:DUF624 domain-containing protein n=1 Tax=Lysobacter korlensis TaxID=553636 RepID=A0ABV6RT79_9GAMM
MAERSLREERRAERAARRDERSGAGPARDGHDPGRLPGATAKFALFGEVLFTGILVTGLSLPVVSIPLAFAVGTRHLRRFVRGESSSMELVWRDLAPRNLLRSLPVGLGFTLLVAVLAVDLMLGYDGVVPGAGLALAVGWVGLAVVATTLLTASRLWEPERGWLAALRGCWPEWRSDPVAVLYLLAGVVFVGAVSWQLLPLVVPGIGCLILAILAIPQRPRRTAAPVE